MCKISDTDRVFIWRPLLEEYSPEIEYIPGDKIWWHIQSHDFPMTGIKILHTSSIIKWKIFKNFM